MRPARILRAITLTVFTLLVVLFVFIQIQQRLLRHRAERLHAEIVALQLHPGTFADIQRLQKEWGRHAHYEGECTPHHCIYQIVIDSLIDELLYKHDLPYWGAGYPWTWLGAKFAFADANVRVHDNRMWGEDFSLSMNETFVRIMGSPHLFQSQQTWRASALQRHYRDGFEKHCTGCIGAEIYLTPETSPSDVAWLNDINFSCLTRLRTCEGEEDLIPGPWSRRDHIDFVSNETYSLREVPVAILGLEAAQAMSVQITAVKTNRDGGDVSYDAEIRILEPLKNADAYGGPLIKVQFEPSVIRSGRDSPQEPIPGQTYILAYYAYPNMPQIEVKALIPATQQNLDQFRLGMARDPSIGEPEDWRSHLSFP